jgi:siroheme synthase-like protein
VADVDRAVVDDATAAGVAVNSADGDTPGTVHLPAVRRRGRVTVSVSTGGASPALARWLAERVAAALPDHVEVLADLVDQARVDLRRQGRSPGTVDWEAVLARVVPLVGQGRTDEARRVLGDL